MTSPCTLTALVPTRALVCDKAALMGACAPFGSRIVLDVENPPSEGTSFSLNSLSPSYRCVVERRELLELGAADEERDPELSKVSPRSVEMTFWLRICGRAEDCGFGDTI